MSNFEKSSAHGTPYFSNMNEQAGQITDQNNRYDQLATDPQFEDLEDMRQVAVDNLWLEQAYTLDGLKGQDLSLYDQLAAEHMATERDLREVQDRYATITDQEDARSNRIRAAAKRAIELSPLSEESVNELAAEKIKALHDMNREELAVRIGELTAHMAQLDEVFNFAGKAWEIPRVPNGATENTPEFIDILPVDPGTQSQEGGVYARNVEEYKVKAAVEITRFLLATKGDIITDKAIADEVYADERDFDGKSDAEIDERNRRAAGRLMRPDASVTKLLAEQGLAIQYGWRLMVYPGTETKVKGSRKLRIYRIAEQDIVDSAEELVEYRPYLDLTEEEPADSSEAEMSLEPTEEVLVSRELLDWLTDNGLIRDDGKKIPIAQLKARLLDGKLKGNTPVELAKYRQVLREVMTKLPVRGVMTSEQVVQVAVGALDDPGMEAQVYAAMDNYYAENDAQSA